MKFYRANGDCLSLLLCSDDTQSTAQLSVEDDVWEVSSYLPGLNRKNVDVYVKSLGFTGRDKRIDVVQNALVKVGYSADSLLLIHEDYLCVSIVLATDRCIPCPPIVAVGRFHPDSGRLFDITIFQLSASTPLLAIKA